MTENHTTDPSDMLAALAKDRAGWEAQLSIDPERQGEQRRAISIALETAFFQMAAYLKPSLSIEIGAHEASFSKTMRSLSPDTVCIGFEANPIIFKRYREELTGLGIIMREIAVSNREGDVQIHVPVREGKVKKSMTSLLPPADQATETETFTVKAAPLDALISDPANNVLWIDVEGATGQVLAGAGEALSACLALYIEVEAEPRWAGQACEPEIATLLAGADLIPFLTDIQRRDWQHNMVFVRPAAISAETRNAVRAGFIETADTILSPGI